MGAGKRVIQPKHALGGFAVVIHGGACGMACGCGALSCLTLLRFRLRGWFSVSGLQYD